MYNSRHLLSSTTKLLTLLRSIQKFSPRLIEIYNLFSKSPLNKYSSRFENNKVLFSKLILTVSEFCYVIIIYQPLRSDRIWHKVNF